MSWLTIPAGSVEEVLALTQSESILRVLAKVKEKVEEIENKSAIELLDMLMEDPDKYKDSIGTAIAKISGKSVEEVMADWAELKAKYNSEQLQRLRALSRTYDQLKTDSTGLPKQIQWSPLDRDIDKNHTPNSTVTLNVKGMTKAAIDFEALATKPPVPSDANISHGGKHFCRIGIEGKLSVEGRAGISGGPMTLDLAGSSAGEIDADIYFQEEGDTRFGVSIAENLRDLIDCGNTGDGVCSPFQAAALATLVKQQGLYCLSLKASGNLVFGGAVTIGKTVNLAEKVKASIGATIGYTANKTGSFDYLLSGHEVDGEQAIAIQVKRAKGREEVINQSLSLELDPRELAQRLTPIIKDHLGKAEDAMSDFSDMLPGSDFVVNELSELIDDKFESDTAIKDMVRSLVGLDPSLTPEQVLRNRIIGKIETSAEAWSSDIEVAVGSITGEVIKSLPPWVVNLPALKEKVGDAVNEALTKKREMLLTRLTDKITSANDYKNLAKLLNETGAGISKTVSDVQTGIDRARAAIEQLLNKMQRRINEMRGYMEAATEKVVKLRIASEQIEKQLDTLDLRFDLFPGRDGAQEVLSAILIGDMNRVMNIIDQQGDDSPVIAHSGSFTVYQGMKETGTLDLILWNLQLGTESILDANVIWVVGIDGTITAMSQAKFERTNQSAKEKRTVSFIESAQMLFADRKRSLSVGMTISHEDEELEAHEVRAFLDGVVDRGLLPRTAIERALALLDKAGDKKAKKGRLDVGLTLNHLQLKQMMAHVESMKTETNCEPEDVQCRLPQVRCVGPNAKPGCNWVLDTIANLQGEIIIKHHSKDGMIKRLAKVIKVLEIQGGFSGAIRQMTPQRWKRLEKDYRFNEDSLPYTDEYNFLRETSFLEYRRYGAMAMYEILGHMKALADTDIGVRSKDDGAQDIPGWTPDSIQLQQWRIAQLMPIWWEWTHEGKEWWFLSDQMRASTIAFLESWVELAKGPDGEGPAPVLWASISLQSDNGELVPKLLT